MIFKSEIVKSQWDTWGYYHEGTYFLYYLIADGRTWDGFGVATSTDGVHWHDHGWEVQHMANRTWAYGPAPRFRVLARRGMLEFYLDDQFIECFMMGCPDAHTVRCTLLPGASDVRAWQMSL